MGKILAMTFPKQDISLGLEPSVLTVVPDGDNVEYILDYTIDKYKDEEVDLYLCSIYITGMHEFIKWSRTHTKSKIVAGGYEPTINPDDFLDYAERVIIGPCDDFWKTMEQEGRVVKGVTSNKRIPRYDLYDIRLNQQIIPDKEKEAIVTSINTSQGCPFKCDFCCSPLMCDHIMSKPLSLVIEEVNYLKKWEPEFIFIRDENFPLQKDWKDKLIEIEKTGAKIYLFASANLLTEPNVQFMKQHNVYMICLGLEDITVEYSKNKQLDTVCDLLHTYGIYVYLSFIVNPTKLHRKEDSDNFYKKLLERFYRLKPEMVCGNFLMPFRGTKLWEEYKDLVSFEDFKYYNSKSAFLEKDLKRRAEQEFDMFKYQWEYYMSDFYKKNVRNFETQDTLHLRFLELRAEFEQKGFRVN